MSGTRLTSPVALTSRRVPAITWTGDIPVGGVVTVTGTLTVKNPDPGNRVVTGTLATTAPGSNCAAGSTDVRCTAMVAVLWWFLASGRARVQLRWTGLRLEMGKFTSPYGTEVIDGYEGWNDQVTRSLIFVLGPYTHTGLRASYSFSDTDS